MLNKFQIPIFKDSNFVYWNLMLGYWCLFGTWCLVIGAYSPILPKSTPRCKENFLLRLASFFYLSFPRRRESIFSVIPAKVEDS
jgi:hypothetical protein